MQTITKPLPKYKRQYNTINLVVTKDDDEILKLVHKYRFLNSVQLSLLTGRQITNLRVRLKKLFHNGYLDRPRNQKNYDNKPIVHALGHKGAERLFELGIIEEKVKTDWTAKNREVQTPFIHHEMMINDFHVGLIHNLGRNFLGWRTDLIFEIGKEKLIPDSFIGLVIDGKKKYFFLEADRSTMTTETYFKKLQKYWEFWKSRHIEKVFKDVDNFRVLTLTKSRQRSENLRLKAKEVDDRKEGSALFCFASSTDFNLEKPESLLAMQWQTPKNDNKHSVFC